MPGRFPRSLEVALMLTLASLISDPKAQSDSSDLLFDESVVHAYQLDFYDSSWASRLEAFRVADSGYLPARFSDGVQTIDSVGVRYKGNSSYTYVGNSPKKPFKIKFNEFRSQTYHGVKVLNFSNGVGDPTFLREVLSYRIARTILPAPRSSFATLEANGVAIGLYTQVEQVDKTFLKRWYPNASGNLFKAGDDGAPLQWLGESARYDSLYELKTNEKNPEWSRLKSILAALDTLADGEFCGDPDRWISSEDAIRMVAFNMVLSHFDSYSGSGRNYYLYEDSASRGIRLLPWDLNLSYGAYGNSWNVVTQDPIEVSNLAARPLSRRLARCPALKAGALSWIRHLVATEASVDTLQARIARLSSLIKPYVEADPNRIYSLAAFETNQTSTFRPSPSSTIPGLVSFATARNAWLSSHVDSVLAGMEGVAVPRHRSVGSDWVLHFPKRSGVSGMPPGADILWAVVDARGRIVSRGRARSDASGWMGLPILPGSGFLRVATVDRTRTFPLLPIP
ncbi:MAG: CotH kinase family protein [Fibrobacteria bacterium]|nr:CotH kinase family protein [Fibrobacteria bacterium]